jgi:STE24 endopeptidase
MNGFTYAFLLALGAGLLLQNWLLVRQRRHVARHRDAVPEAFAVRIPLEAHRKAADYTLSKVALARVSLLYNAVLLLAWTLGGGLALVDALWARSGLPPVWEGVALMVSVFLLMSLLDLPLGLWATFRLETRFGFNRTTPVRYALDVLLQGVLLLSLGIPLGWGILAIMRGAGDLWWIAAWALWMAFTLLVTWGYPTLIAPLFNRFKPLPDEGLRRRIESLLERCGFRSGGIFVMDGSQRSTHGNAYFTGLGAQKRIVFFDTLLDSLEPDEVEAVLAHELGHFKYRHLLKRLLTAAALSLASFALLGWLSGQDWFYTGLGVQRQTDALALLLFLMVSPVFLQFFQPVGVRLSRRHEFQADDFAARQTRADWLVSALIKLYRENASTLTPDPLYSAFHDSHPPAPVRVANLSSRSWGETR